jgi:Flp pilus assembly pilin Flp
MKKRWLNDSAGQGLIEYGLVLVAVALAVVLAASAMGVDISNIFCQVTGDLGAANICGHIFVDDFADLSFWEAVIGNWQVVNGDLKGGPGEGRLFHQMSKADYVITLDKATLNQGDGYGVFFRTNNAQKVDGYSFQYDPGYGGGAFIMRKWVHGNELAPFAVASAPGYNWNAPNRQIQVAIKGNTYTAYVDGKPVVSGTDSTYTKGGVGLRTWGNSTVSFGKVTVDVAK